MVCSIWFRMGQSGIEAAHIVAKEKLLKYMEINIKSLGKKRFLLPIIKIILNISSEFAIRSWHIRSRDLTLKMYSVRSPWRQRSMVTKPRKDMLCYHSHSKTPASRQLKNGPRQTTISFILRSIVKVWKIDFQRLTIF